MRALAVVVALFAGVSVQDTVAQLPFTLNIGQLSTAQLTGYCAGETGTCSVLCSQNTETNSCVQTPSLNWACTCASNSSEPGLKYYETSMFSFLCQQAYGQCISANANDLSAQQSLCVSSIQPICGTLKTENFSPTTAVTVTSATTVPAVTTATTTHVTTTTSSHNVGPTAAVFGGGAAAIMAVGMLVQAL